MILFTIFLLGSLWKIRSNQVNTIADRRASSSLLFVEKNKSIEAKSGVLGQFAPIIFDPQCPHFYIHQGQIVRSPDSQVKNYYCVLPTKRYKLVALCMRTCWCCLIFFSTVSPQARIRKGVQILHYLWKRDTLMGMPCFSPDRKQPTPSNKIIRNREGVIFNFANILLWKNQDCRQFIVKALR